MLRADTRLVLVNAVYLKDRWAEEFAKSATKPRDFHKSAKVTVKVPMMRREGGAFDYGYAAMPGFQAVSIKTKDRQSSLVLLVPTEVDGLAALEAKLDAALLRKTLTALTGRKVILTLPKFKVTSAMSLKDALARLGVKRLFAAGKADLGAIDGGQDRLYVADVVHKAYVDVNEEGIEATAATAAMAFAGAAMPKPVEPVTVTVDRPFLYLVQDQATHTLLFLGRVVDPS
jgi:serpin B